LRRDSEQAVELAIPLALKNDVRIEPQPPEFVLGKPIDAPGPDFEISESEIAEIHRFVRDDVLPAFVKFFPGLPRLTTLPS
jgi:hypothetical protein